MVTQKYNLDLDKKQQDPILTNILLTQGDNQVYIFDIKIVDGSQPIDYSQVATSRIIFAKSDGTTVQGTLIKTTDGYTYELGTNEIAAAGDVMCSVLLYGANNERLTTSRFVFKVVSDMLSPSTVESSTEFDALTKAIMIMEQLEAKLIDFPNIKMIGIYPTQTALIAAYPDGSKLDGGFFVTETSSFYIWDRTKNEWASIGKVSAGPKGEEGDKGDKGDPTTVNGKGGANIILTPSDIGALPVDGKAVSAQSASTADNGTFTLTHSKVGVMHQLKGIPYYDYADGKNLLPLTVTSQDSNGVVFTVNENRSISIVGTAMSGWTGFIVKPIVLEAGQYTLSAGVSIPSGLLVYIEHQHHSELISRLSSTEGSNKTFSLASSTACKFVIYAPVGVAFDCTIYPQLEKGSVATAYEPFRPKLLSAKFRAEFDCIYADTWERVSETNLMPNIATTQTINGMTFTVNTDKSITINGTPTADAYLKLGNVTLKANETYTISSSTPLSTNVNLGCHKDSQFPLIIETPVASITKTLAYDFEGDGYVWVRGGTVVTNLTIYPQLVKGTELIPYEPQSMQLIPTITGFNKSDIVDCTICVVDKKIKLPEIGVNENLAINSSFEANQRGQMTYSALDYTVDNWVSTGGSIVCNVTRSAHGGGFGGYYINLALVSASPGAWHLFEQRCEDLGGGISTYAGRGLFTVTAICSCNSDYRSLFIRYTDAGGVQHYTATSILKDVTRMYSVTTSIPQNAKQVAYGIGASRSITSSDVGTYLNIWDVKLEASPYPTPYVRLDLEENLRKCQRYYERIDWYHGFAYSQDFCATVLYKVTKRIGNPTIKVFSANNVEGKVSYKNEQGQWIDVPVSSVAPSSNFAMIYVTNAAITNKVIAFHVISDAEIY